MIPKKIELNFYGILTQKMLFHKFDTKNINLLSFACQNCYQKNPILRREIDLPEKFGQMNTLYFPKFSVKMCCFGQNNSGTAP